MFEDKSDEERKIMNFIINSPGVSSIEKPGNTTAITRCRPLFNHSALQYHGNTPADVVFERGNSNVCVRLFRTSVPC